MTGITVKHAFVSAKSDGTDNTLVQPSAWNAPHTLLLDADFVLGRASAGNGPVEQIACGAVSRALLSQTTTAAWLSVMGAVPVAGGAVGPLTVTGALVAQSTVGVTGLLTGTSAQFTTTLIVGTTSQLTGAVTCNATLGVTGVTTLSANLIGTTATFSGAVTVNGALNANGGIVAQNCATAWVRFSGGGITQSFNVSNTVFAGTGTYNVTFNGASGLGSVVVTPESATAVISTVQWLSGNTFQVRFYNTSGAAFDPQGWGAVIFR